MSTAKRQIVLLILVVFSIWPLAHRVLVMHFDSDPWRNFGLAMYCAISVNGYVDYAVTKNDELLVRDTVQPSRDIEKLRRLFGQKRFYYGRFASPRPLVEQLFETHPTADGVVIGFRKLYLSPTTHHLEILENNYRYARSSNGEISKVGERYQRDSLFSTR